MRTLLAALFCAAALAPAALADYSLPPLAERYVLIAPGGSIGAADGGRTLTLTRDGKPRTLPIDLFFLCDRIGDYLLSFYLRK